MAKAYKIYNRENQLKAILGNGQLKEYATVKLVECKEEMSTEKLQLKFEPTDIKAIVKIYNKVIAGESVATLNQAKLIMKLAKYKMQEIDLY